MTRRVTTVTIEYERSVDPQRRATDLVIEYERSVDPQRRVTSVTLEYEYGAITSSPVSPYGPLIQIC